MGNVIHKEKHPLAGQTVKLKTDAVHFQYPDFGGSDFIIEDWQDRVTGKSWADSVDDGNIACYVYFMRALDRKFPMDDEVVYGHRRDGLGSLVHVSELDI